MCVTNFCCTRSRATSLLPSAHSFTLTLQMHLLHMNRPCSGWRQQQILSYRKPFTLPHLPILSTVYIGHFYTRPFCMLTFVKPFGLKRENKSSGTGNGGWWLPRFHATRCKNYATEAANLVVNLTARFPKHISYIAIHNRTVNMDGKPGHGKPLDQVMEHYNL